MSREIKFRGKRKDTPNDWISGDLNHKEGSVFIFPRNGDSNNSPDYYEVIPETVQQLVVNGIYEGDVIEFTATQTFPKKDGTVSVKEETKRGRIVYSTQKNAFVILYREYISDDVYDQLHMDIVSNCKVIGNIIDNEPSIMTPNQRIW